MHRRRIGPSSLLVVAALACGGESATEPTGSMKPVFTTTPPGEIGHDELYEWEVSVSDPTGTTPTLRASGLPSWLTLDAAARRLSGTPGESNIGSHQVTLVAEGAGGATVNRFSISVVIGTSTLVYDGSWLEGTSGQVFIGHDGQPHETEHFIVFSDFSSTDSRVALGDLLEEALEAIKDSFGILSDDEFDFTNADGKIHVLADKLHGPHNGWAYRDGLIVMAPDAPRYVTQGYYPARYRGLVTHELTHVVGFLLRGSGLQLHATDAWEREGIATYVAGLAPGGTPLISTMAEVDAWRARQAALAGGGNPIAVHLWTDFPSEVSASGQQGTYYAIFALAVQYLVDPEGHGGDLSDMRNVYLDIRAGRSWPEALAHRFGIDLAEYEADFWDLMREYLP
ncbi:MAG: putative Ig domain-containing protein [Gemmatimonadota bacterium]|nr:putative Ig domain-containing protein [Gemmatimonadota bacterium]